MTVKPRGRCSSGPCGGREETRRSGTLSNRRIRRAFGRHCATAEVPVSASGTSSAGVGVRLNRTRDHLRTGAFVPRRCSAAAQSPDRRLTPRPHVVVHRCRRRPYRQDRCLGYFVIHSRLVCHADRRSWQVLAPPGSGSDSRDIAKHPAIMRLIAEPAGQRDL